MKRIACVPFAAFVLPIAPLFAQQAQPQPTLIEIPLMVRGDLPDIDSTALKHLLWNVATRKDTAEVVLASVGGSGKVIDSSLDMSVVVPHRQVLLHVRFQVGGGADPQAGSSATAPVAKHFEAQLNELFHRPWFVQLTKQLSAAEGVAQAAEEQRGKLANAIAAVGFDDLAAAQEALVGLQQKRLDVELELRTEQAMQARLQEQAARAQAQQAQLQDRTSALREGRDAAERTLGELGSVPHPQRGKDHEARLAQIEAEIRSLAVELDRVHDATNQARSLYNEAAAALTTSTIALQRHQSRAQVLDELIARQQHVVEEAASRARERDRVAQELARASAEADAARARVLELRRERDALQPVQVTPWR